MNYQIQKEQISFWKKVSKKRLEFQELDIF